MFRRRMAARRSLPQSGPRPQTIRTHQTMVSENEEEEEQEEQEVARGHDVLENEEEQEQEVAIEYEVIDLTRDESPEIEIVHSTVVPSASRSAKRPRMNPSKALEALDQLAAAAAMRPSSRVPAQPESPKGPKCGICLESMGGDTSRQMMAGNCGHVYCRDCLEHTVKTTKKCPTCRKGLQVRQLHPVFVQF